MKSISLLLAVVSGLVMMLTLGYSSQVQAQAVELQCQMEDEHGKPSDLWIIAFNADRSIITVTVPSLKKRKVLSPAKGKYQGHGGCVCTDFIYPDPYGYSFGFFCDAPCHDRQDFRVDRQNGLCTIAVPGQSIHGTCIGWEGLGLPMGPSSGYNFYNPNR